MTPCLRRMPLKGTIAAFLRLFIPKQAGTVSKRHAITRTLRGRRFTHVVRMYGDHMCPAGFPCSPKVAGSLPRIGASPHEPRGGRMPQGVRGDILSPVRRQVAANQEPRWQAMPPGDPAPGVYAWSPQ